MPSYITCVPYSNSGSGGITPTSITGCALWLDASDTSTTSMTFSSGSNINLWKDKSGSNNHFSVSSGTPSAISDGGRTVVNIPSGAVMTSANQITFTTSSSFFVVSKVTSISGLPYIVGFTNISASDYAIRINTGILNGTAASTGNANDMANGTYYVNGTYNPNFNSSYYNNVYTIINTDNPQSSGTSYVTLSTAFMSRYFVGTIAEFLYYPAGVSSNNRQSLEGYLAQKWGLTLSLAAGHPGLTNTYYGSGSSTKPRTFMTKQVYTSQGPLSVAGCVMWLDGADPAGTGTAPSNGVSVSTWVDKSGSNNSGTAGSAATYSSSQRALLFGTGTGSAASYSQNAWPSGNYYTTPYTANPTNETCYLVFNLPVIGYGFAISGHSCGGRSFATPTSGGYPTTTQLLGGVNCYSWGVTASSSIYANTTYIGKLITNSNNQYGSINGSNMAGPTAQSPSSVTTDIGAQNANSIYFNGYIKEILFYNRVLSSNEQLTVEAYLASKWGITASLPAGNPTSTAITPTGKVTNFLTYTPKYTINNTSFYNVSPEYWTNVWQPYLQQMATANAGATVSFTGMIGVSGGPGYNSGCLAPNGYIYFCSRTSYSSNILVFNPATETVVTTLGTGLTGHHTAVLGPNGLIYMFPTDTNNTGILVVDPVAGTANTFITGIISSRYYSGSLAPNGYIYFWTMGGSGTLYKLLPGPNTISTVTTFTGAYNTGTLGPNNCIYLTPESGTGNVLVINTVNDTISTIGSGLGRYGCLALAPNGYMYGSPIDNLSSEPILIINTSNNSVSTYGTVGGYVQGFTLGANGKLYSAPGSGSYPPYAVTPNGTTPSITSLTTTSANVYGSILAPNGNIYGVSATSANAIYAIRFSGLVQLPSLAYCLSPYTNKPSN